LGPWLAIGASMGLFTAWVEKHLIGAQGAVFSLSPAQHLVLAGRIIWFYAGKLLLPLNLTFSYAHWKIVGTMSWQYLYPAGIVVVGLCLLLLARRKRGPLASFIIFIVMLFPVLGFLNVLPFRYSWVADHFQYLASLGIIVPLSALIAGNAVRIVPAKPIRVSAMVACALLLGTLTFRESAMFRNDETLYRDTLMRNPDSWLAHNNLGSILLESPERLPDAIKEFEMAVRLEPDYPESHFNLGSALSRSGVPGDLAKAIAEYQTAVRIKPDDAEGFNNLGSALSRVPGRLPDAIAAFRTALKINPDYAKAHNNLGKALVGVPGHLSDAISEFQSASRLAPDNAEVHANLGGALAQMPGRLPEAITELEVAVKLNPNLAGVHYNLGTVLSEVPGRLPDAIAEFEIALRIQPDFEPAQYALQESRRSLPATDISHRR
jgi:tetratricopeptide (TPR) repeat protein